MNWEQISYNIEQFWNKPVPIIGFTVGAIIIGVLAILAKTSIGKKSLLYLKKQYNELKEKATEAFDAYDKLIAQKDEIIDTMKSEYEEKLALIQENKDREREIIIAIGENIHNVKIQKIIEEYKKLPEIADISEVIESKKIELEEKYEAKEAELEEKINAKLAEIESALLKIKEKTEPIIEEIKDGTEEVSE